MERRIVVALLTLTLLTAPQLSTAYEDDVHFGLTKWLALQAGFTEPQAVGVGCQYGMGRSQRVSRHLLVPWYACVRRDAFGSREIQKIHFPGDGKVPGKAALRAVTPRDTEGAATVQ